MAIKVLSDGGSGAVSDVISGINYAYSQFDASSKPSVATISLGGLPSTTLDSAVSAVSLLTHPHTPCIVFLTVTGNFVLLRYAHCLLLIVKATGNWQLLNLHVRRRRLQKAHGRFYSMLVQGGIR